MVLEGKVRKLKKFIKSLAHFKIVKPCIPYDHMGATITDALLQAGIRWETAVKPRVEKLKKLYPEAKTSSGFLKLLESKGANKLLQWSGPEKPKRILNVTRFFVAEGIETEADLKAWFESRIDAEERLKRLRGIGNKTADYFKMLCGIPTSAVDRHLMEFLKKAGIDTESYSEAREVIHKCAEQMGLNETLLDHSIWRYMSERGRKLCK